VLSSGMSIPVPYAITRQDDGLLIEWDQAGHQAFYPARELRLACPCAACVEEMTGRPLLDPATVRADVRPSSVALVGGYGLRIQWSDGHATGIYTFERLRRSCPCEACRAGQNADGGG
jgi:ATP-binding protein involved in chromosome partitioning